MEVAVAVEDATASYGAAPLYEGYLIEMVCGRIVRNKYTKR